MKIQKQAIALVMLLAMLLALPVFGVNAMVCTAEAAAPKTEKYSGYVFDAFDTTTTITAYTSSAEEFNALLAEADAELTRYHKLYDIYNAYDGIVNLYEVNLRAGKEPVEVPQDIMDILVFSKELYHVTGGYMNIAFGTVLRIWHDVRDFNNNFPNETPIMPEMEALQAANEHCSMDDLILDPAAGTVYFADPEMKLDVGAVAKGYAVERLAQTLAAEGFGNVLINAGGNVRAVGNKVTGENWIIGVQNPDLLSDKLYVAKASINDMAVITSGVYQRFFEYEGKRYHHIIDKDTLKPEDRYQAVTIIINDSGRGDALSTAVFNMPYEDGLAFIEGMDGVEAMWILNDGTEYFSSGFESYLIP